MQDERIAEVVWVGVVIRSNGGGAGANRNSLIVFQFATIDGSRAQSRLPVCRPSCWESNFSLGQPRTPARIFPCPSCEYSDRSMEKKKNDIFQTIVFNVKSMILDGEINRWILKIIGICIWYFYPSCVDTRN